MSNFPSLKKSLNSLLKDEGNLISNKNTSSQTIFKEEFFLSTLSIFLQYCHANKKIEKTTANELERLRNEHNEVMKSLEQDCNERNSILDLAKSLITEGIKKSDEKLIIQGVDILKGIITNPIKRKD